MAKSPTIHQLRLIFTTKSRVTVRTRSARLLLALGALALILAAACGDDGGGGTATPDVTGTPTPVATPLPPDAAAGTGVFQAMVDAVQANDVEKAWGLYAASIPGTTDEHNGAFGCDFGAFSYELPRLQHLFDRMAPFQVTETYGAAPGSMIIEMRLLGANGTSFLGTVVRTAPLEQYRVQFLNSGEVTVVPGAPDPQPSPDDPMGICGMWTGPR